MANTARRDKGPQPIEDLRWFYAESETELGIEAIQLRKDGGEAPSANPPGGPTAEQCRAAGRQARIQRVLNELSGQHRAALEACYELRALPTQLTSEWGQASGAIHRAQQVHNNGEGELRRELLKAGAACRKWERGWEVAQRQLLAMADVPSAPARTLELILALKAEKRSLDAAALYRARRRALREYNETLSATEAQVLALVHGAHEAYRRHRQAQRADEQQHRQEQAETAEARRIARLEESRTRKRKCGFSSKTQDRINAVAKMVMEMMAGLAA